MKQDATNDNATSDPSPTQITRHRACINGLFIYFPRYMSGQQVMTQ